MFRNRLCWTEVNSLAGPAQWNEAKLIGSLWGWGCQLSMSKELLGLRLKLWRIPCLHLGHVRTYVGARREANLRAICFFTAENVNKDKVITDTHEGNTVRKIKIKIKKIVMWGSKVTFFKNFVKIVEYFEKYLLSYVSTSTLCYTDLHALKCLIPRQRSLS